MLKTDDVSFGRRELRGHLLKADANVRAAAHFAGWLIKRTDEDDVLQYIRRIIKNDALADVVVDAIRNGQTEVE